MWGWAALLGGLAVVIAADLAGGQPAIERRAFGRAGSETDLDRRDQRALALARNFAAWHQAATAHARMQGTLSGVLDEREILRLLPGYYAKAGAWRSVYESDGTVRTSDDGVAGIAVGGGAVGRFLASTTGYAGLAGLGWHGFVAVTRPGGGAALPVATVASSGHGVRITLPDVAVDPRDQNAP
ncbi:MAG: hypothetical protein JWM77_3712 [Rhodospirillales bacterium]|nr:hypothetical protein [Rhodospirillales bacterium]